MSGKDDHIFFKISFEVRRKLLCISMDTTEETQMFNYLTSVSSFETSECPRLVRLCNFCSFGLVTIFCAPLVDCVCRVFLGLPLFFLSIFINIQIFTLDNRMPLQTSLCFDLSHQFPSVKKALLTSQDLVLSWSMFLHSVHVVAYLNKWHERLHRSI